MLWLWSAVLVTAISGFAAWPFLRRIRGGTADAQDRQRIVRDLYRDRLAELEVEQAAGQISVETRAEVEQELAATLLSDYQAESTSSESQLETGTAKGAGAMLGLLVGFLVPLVSLGMYLSVGEPNAEQIRGAEQVFRLDPGADAVQLAAWRERLKERLARHRDDARSSYLLGYTELQLGNYAAASNAFAIAHAGLGEDSTIDVYWLQASFLASRGEIDGKTRAIAERILARDPNQPLVLELFAIDAFRRGDFNQAVGYLNRALSAAVGPTQRVALQAGLAQARAGLGDLNPSFDVAISVAETPPPGATLFVLARPPGGGMPYAVVKRPVRSVPLTVRLDDAVSMNPAAPLSSAEQVEVVVRISQSGSPRASPGDWEWQSTPIDLADVTEPQTLQAVLSPGLEGG